MLDDGHPVKSLPPTVEKSDTHKSVTNKVTGLADEMMYLRPMGRADRPKEPNPQRVKPLASVICREGGGGLEGDHQNTQRRRHPIQHPLQDRLRPKFEGTHALYYRGRHAQGRVAPTIPAGQIFASGIGNRLSQTARNHSEIAFAPGSGWPSTRSPK